MDETRIFFLAEPDQPGGENRLDPTGGLTDYLTDHLDFSGKTRIPKIGYRFPVFLRIESEATPEDIGSTHYRKGDWVVKRVERYPAGSPGCSCKEIVVCYCIFEPIKTELKPLGKPTVSVDSFGGDVEAYRKFLESEDAKKFVHIK